MSERGIRRKLVGIVISNQMDKTAGVLVERLTRDKHYGKFLRRRAKYLVHDPKNLCQLGDKVRIVESRPISKLKKWQVVEILHRAEIA